MKQRNNIIKVFVAGISLIGLNSCSDYLSEVPDNRTDIDSAEKIAELLTLAYPEGSYMPMTYFMSDNADDKALASRNEDLPLKAYQWETPLGEDSDTPIYYWNSCYEAIAQANHALEAIEELDLNDETGERSLAELRGEGLLARAYAHFMLVNLWGEHYDPTTSGTELGVPYVTEPETKLLTTYTRQTVEEVYKMIEDDLLEGLSLVENNYEEPSYHFTPEAALAFAVRFYLFKGEWDKVIDYSSQLLGASPENRVRNWVVYSELQYAEIANLFSNTEEQTNLLLAYTSSTFSRSYANSRFGLTSDLANELFFNSSTNPFNKGWSYPVYGTDEVFNLPKFQEYFRYTNQSAGIGYVFVPNVLFSYDEVLLARAEAYAMTNKFDSSLEDMEILLPRKTENYNNFLDNLTETGILNRYPNAINEYDPYYDLTPKQASFVKFIAEVRRREYYSEGLRWFDIKRFHLSFEHELAGGSDLTLAKNDNRRLLQIPQNAISLGMEANPR